MPFNKALVEKNLKVLIYDVLQILQPADNMLFNLAVTFKLIKIIKFCMVSKLNY